MEGLQRERTSVFSQLLIPAPYQNLWTRIFQWEVDSNLELFISFFLSPHPQNQKHFLNSLFLFCRVMVLIWFFSRLYSSGKGLNIICFCPCPAESLETFVDWNLDCFVPQIVSASQKSLLPWLEYLEVGLPAPFYPLMWAQLEDYYICFG